MFETNQTIACGKRARHTDEMNTYYSVCVCVCVAARHNNNNNNDAESEV